ncbi:MAG: TonB-dependent receptor [Cyclobacteriaceae bacterium]|nr:TonB-dependent receptor [Cyclobacteriaceae bacterium]
MMRNLYRKLSLTMCFLLTIASVMAQERTVSGTVTDETGSTMPGVNVLLKGTSSGTVTDGDGNFRISIPNDQAVLVISFVGYATSEVIVGSRSVVNIQLTSDVQTLTELVVTGYSVDKRRELTGSVSTVKAKELTIAPTGNVEQMLQGRVAGVTVITNGQPGTTSQIRVRGFGAFGGNSPLYIVDGVPTDNVNFINPDDIESVTVLKDAAAASIYGARAASGVIIYTTKKGTKGGGRKLSVTYDQMVGVTNPGKGIEMLNPTDFAEWTWNAIKNTEDANARAENRSPNYGTALANFNHPQFGGGLTPTIPQYLRVGSQNGAAITGPVDLAAQRLLYNIDPRNGPIYNVIAANREGTDWYDAITRNAPVTRQTLGFSGGGDGYRFYVGLSGQDQKGILLHQSFKRYAMRANAEFDVKKNIRVGLNTQFTYRQALGLVGDGGGIGSADDENDILAAFRMPTIIPVYNVFGGYAGTAAGGFNNPRNPVANRDGQRDDRNFNGMGFGNVYAEYDVIPGLTLRTSIGGSYTNYAYKFYGRWQYENSENNSAFTFGQGSGYNFGWTFTNTANYKKTFDIHNLDILIGQEALNTGAGWDLSATGLNPFSWDPNFVNLTQTSSRIVNSSQYLGVNFYSLFGRVNYSLKEKYILSAVVRRDGASRFGANNRFGVFPAVSLAWRISDEAFMDALPFVSDLKIRGGYGAMGNSNNVDPNNQFSLYGGSLGASSYDITGSNSSVIQGFYRTRIGNPNAKWETSITKNIGFDGNLFDGRLDIILDFWEKDTKDLLLAVPITATAGPNAAVPSVNIGRMLNRGLDIAITGKGKFSSDLSYEATLNGSFLKNEITELPPGQTYLITVNPGYRGITPIRNQLGGPISGFFGYKVQGIFKTQEEVNNAPAQAGKGIGRFRYEDINKDGTINDLDRTALGSPVPKFTGGFNFVLRYKNFDLEAYTYVSLGNKIFNVSKWFTDFYPSFQGASISARVKDSWSPTNTGASTPIFESASNFSTNTQSSSFYVEDGSYLRMQNLTLGYNIPSATLNRIGLNRVRIFASTNNLFTITKYSGLDPSVGGAADTSFGIDVGNYPITRSFTGGFNIGF